MIKRLLILNGLAAIGAVIHHANIWVLTAMFWWADRYQPVSIPNYDQVGNADYWTIRLIDQVASVAVPVFLFVSGFFVAFATARNRTTLGWDIVFNRVKNLLPPYLFWSGLIIGVNIVKGESYTLGELFGVFVKGEAIPPFYYVPLLIQCFILSPFIVPLARNRWKLLLAVAFFIQILLAVLHYLSFLKVEVSGQEQFFDILRNSHILELIIWFIIGVIAGFHVPRLKQLVANFKWLFLVLIILTFIISLIEWEILRELSGEPWIAPQSTLFYKFFALSLLLGYLALENFVPLYSHQISEIGVKSYGIYLVHLLALEYTARMIYHITPWLLAYELLFLPILVVMGVGIPLLLMRVIKWSAARPFYIYLFG